MKGIVTLAALVLMMGVAQAAPVTCQSSPGYDQHYMWREIDGMKCWYPGNKTLPKSELRWIKPKPKPVIQDEPVPIASNKYRIDDAFNAMFSTDPRLTPLNTYAGHGGGRVRRIGHFLYGTPECCW